MRKCLTCWLTQWDPDLICTEDHYALRPYAEMLVKGYARDHGSSFQLISEHWCMHMLQSNNDCPVCDKRPFYRGVGYKCHDCGQKSFDTEFEHPAKELHRKDFQDRVNPRLTFLCYSCMDARFPDLEGVRTPPDPKYMGVKISADEANDLLREVLGEEFGSVF